jgi:type III pantothenate kinase
MYSLLTIDNGNTNPHVGIFKENVFYRSMPFKDFLSQRLLPEKIPGIISDVGRSEDFFRKMCSPYIDVNSLRKEKSFLDMPVNYSLTLGADRLCQSYYIYKNYLQNDDDLHLLIDAGTFTTVDFISTKGYLGGFIFPGTQTLLSSYDKGSKLSVLNAGSIALSENIIIPQDTNSAIANAIKFIHQATYQKFLSEYPITKVFFTGGFGKNHMDIFKREADDLPLSYEENIIHFSLQEIYHRFDQGKR